MQCVRVEAFGPPVQAARLVEMADPPPPGPREVLVELVAAPVNPADLLMIEGRYDRPPPLPVIPGSEGVARVLEVGAEVRGLARGDLVVPLAGGGMWQARHLFRSGALLRLPAGIDPLQASMLMANPATAQLLLDWVVPRPQPGSWVVQNAANSAVGRMVEALAALRDLRVLNVVRSEAAAVALGQGGGPVIVAGAGAGAGAGELAGQLLEATGGVRPALALDAVGGEATGALASALAEGGTVVTYGVLSGAPARIDLHDLVFRDIRLRGFWLAQFFRSADRTAIAALYDELAGHMAAGRIATHIEAVYPVSKLAAALEHAGRGGRGGKVLLDWSG